MLLQIGLGVVLKAAVMPLLCRQSGLGLLLHSTIKLLEFEEARGLLYREEKQDDSGE